MRTRDEIEKQIEGDVPTALVQNIAFRKLLVELLLDVRELLDNMNDRDEREAIKRS